MTAISHNRQSGFSLIELTVALLIVVLLAGIALRSTTELSFQVRHEQTQERLQRIKEAIIGNPTRTINGQPDISGFVADMGRLPINIHELLEPTYCLDDRTQTTPAGCGASWQSLQIRQSLPDTASGLWYGWNGPYLNISNSATDAAAFTDAWGREAQGLCSDPTFTTQQECVSPATWTAASGDHNYGWWYNISGNAITAFSYGKDHISAGTEYDSDYPLAVTQPVIAAGNWQVVIVQGLDVKLSKPFGVNSFCGFSSSGAYTSERNCKNAGGSWTSPNCTVSETSCKSVGGKWQICFLAPTACTAAGGIPSGQCQFSEKSCNAADGDAKTLEWNNTSHICDLNTQIKCESAGGNWDATLTQCTYSKSQCAIAGGTWFDGCAFTSTNCTNAGGTPGTNPDSCSFPQAACRAINGQSTGSDCYMGHAEFTGEKYTDESCQVAAGLNSAGTRTARICLNVFYRDPNTSLIVFASSAPVYVDENGNSETMHFSVLDTNDIDGDTNVTEAVPWIPMGLNALGIYEYDGDCDPFNNPMYPVGHTTPIPVYFSPSSQVPALNW